MVPFRGCGVTFDEVAEALAATTGEAARFSVCTDDDPVAAVWQGGGAMAVVGAPDGPALPGVVVIVSLRSGLSPWEFLDRFHAPVAALLRRQLPRRVTWRLLFEQGENLVAPARIGYARVGQSLLHLGS